VGRFFWFFNRGKVDKLFMNPIIQLQDLHKQFGQLKAVNGISLSINRGVCFGLLGPNGAGKTTTIEILEGILTPSSGKILYKGRPLDETFRHQAGIMFQHTALQDFMTTREALVMFQHFYENKAPLDQVIKDCSLTAFLEQDNGKLSGGQRQRLLLAIALINDPEVIFLDEPTTGLDPQARRNFWELIKKIKQRNKTVILTTHYMEEAYELCDSIAIMDRGEIIAQGEPAELLRKQFSDVIFQLPKQDLPMAASERPMNMIENDEYIQIRSTNVTETLQELLALNIDLSRLQIRTRTLEDLFIELTGEQLRT